MNTVKGKSIWELARFITSVVSLSVSSLGVGFIMGLILGLMIGANA